MMAMIATAVRTPIAYSMNDSGSGSDRRHNGHGRQLGVGVGRAVEGVR